MNDKPKSKLRWRLLRWGLTGLAVIATLVAILVTEENWRGKHAWETFKREATARGERLDIASVIPPAVPDDQNFFCAPIVADAVNWNRKQNTGMLEPRDTNVVNRMNFDIYRGDSGLWPNDGGNWQKGKLTDLKQWQHYFRDFAATSQGKTNGFQIASQPQTPAKDVLLALSIFDPATEELREASRRPYARLPLDYDNGFDDAWKLLPYLASTKVCAQYLQLRIQAELDDGQSEKALNDLKLLLAVNNSIRDQPFLISHLVCIAMMAITLQPVYEGLAQQRWSDAQLADLEQMLARQDFLADFQFAMRGEKIMAIQSIEKQRITREMKSVDDSAGTNKIVTTSLRWAPSAFFYGTELAFAQMHQQFIVPLVDLTNRVAAPAALREAQDAVKSQMKHYSYYKVQALMVFPAIATAVKKFAMIQSQVDLARTACALERFRLARGNYPDTLDVLAPQFIEKLPHDLINGQPLHYHRTDDGRFVLYSVGWDEKDDGGKIVFSKGGRVDTEKGDWVWQYPAK
ncbi:MAG TPA: hypothetical protein VNN22_06905 [Verrucomicrobiae bacterium]|nr:hypothetical protein [Verrucomicrobiae bacterium]